MRIFDRDLVAAGLAQRASNAKTGKVKIVKRDERGRSIDIHALRHTFGTHLSKGGVAPRTAQAAMRHGDIALTMQVYTDPKLLDVRAALDALPRLPLALKQTPSGKDSASAIARPIALPPVQSRTERGFKGHVREQSGAGTNARVHTPNVVVSGASGNNKGSESTSDPSRTQSG